MKKSKEYISDLIRHLRGNGDVIFLESQMPDHPASTKSFLAAQPKAWIKAWGNKIEIFDGQATQFNEGNSWDYLNRFRQKYDAWLFGYLGYDLKNGIENLKSENPELVQVPDLYFMIPGLLLEVDPEYNTKVVEGGIPEFSKTDLKPADISITPKNQILEADYIQKIERAKRDIFEGKFYEINLSHPIEFELEGDSWNLYESMKSIGPVPFGGYAHINNTAICCSSPERFLAKLGNRVWSQPIKGTASRKKNTETILDIEKLRQSEKERAENLMIVDLVRNDLSRIANKNSVTVSSLFEVQSFETVYQMVSTVECTVNENTDCIDIIKACFPMGSMTGAPKIAAMKAIEEYENYKRGIYSGALGYIKPNGDFDFNVVIRTAIVEGKKLVYPVGGAITSDSDPKAEWEETLVKARAVTNIFENINKAE